MNTGDPGTTINTLWKDNVVLVHAAGLSPVLAVTSVAVNGMALGIATLAVCVAACGTAPILRRRINDSWRLPAFMISLAFYTSICMVVMQAGFYPLYRQLGIYLPLICCNSAILFSMETQAARKTPSKALLDGLWTGTGFFLVILAVGLVRELITYGTVFDGAQLLLPTFLSAPYIADNSAMFPLFRFTLLQPGAFILLGLLVALGNRLTQHK